jgi:thiamine-monophosphate kinase
MGADARWATLALTVPCADDEWLNAFARGAAEALADAGTVLIGGDTTRGPLAISWTILGTVPSGQAMRRDGAAADDLIYVSGTLGGARAALDLLNKPPPGDPDQCAILQCYWRPQPRLALGRELRAVASSCIDVSDGLLADVAHLARRSGCGAEVEFAQMPYLPVLTTFVGVSEARELAANGGEDFELCFTIPGHAEAELRRIAGACDVAVTRIGRMTRDGGVRVVDEALLPLDIRASGYRHFD